MKKKKKKKKYIYKNIYNKKNFLLNLKKKILN